MPIEEPAVSSPSSSLDESGRYCFSGEELVARWGLHPSSLSDAMILGLQAYHPVDFSLICDPYGIHDGMRLSARSRLASVLGREVDGIPASFRSDVSPLTGTLFLPVTLINRTNACFSLGTSEDAGQEPATPEHLIGAHLKLLFRRDDVLRFEKEFGLEPKQEAGSPSALAGQQKTGSVGDRREAPRSGPSRKGAAEPTKSIPEKTVDAALKIKPAAEWLYKLLALKCRGKNRLNEPGSRQLLDWGTAILKGTDEILEEEGQTRTVVKEMSALLPPAALVEKMFRIKSEAANKDPAVVMWKIIAGALPEELRAGRYVDLRRACNEREKSQGSG
jgi:hypothetical protein